VAGKLESLMAKASRSRRESKESGPAPAKRALLSNPTGEPFQPVRLYYSIADRADVTKRLRRLKCMEADSENGGWVWRFEAEAQGLCFLDAGYDDVPLEARPVVLGRIGFPAERSMTLQVKSIPRAVEGARFFAARLGAESTPVRCRLVNRFFALGEGLPHELLQLLDKDVTVAEASGHEARIMRDLQGARTLQEAERALAGSHARILKSDRDVPLVEDFPLHPDEESPEFADLEITLQLRLVRAMEHWMGNTDMTLPALIVRWVREGLAADPDA